ncbi:Uma2 family endonuclease [bacterium]|nr:Uma2 family endonuclease [bacterium]
MSVKSKKQNSKCSKCFTYGDYLTWPENERWEIIDGAAYLMTGPVRIHQKILGNLFVRFYNFLQGKTCEVYLAPFDVRFPRQNENDEEIVTVVQPDIAVICDASKLDDRGCRGSPDLIVEIVSPSTASMDFIKKLNLYERQKVREYWILHPVDKILMVFKFGEESKYQKPEIYSESDKVKVEVLAGLEIDLNEVFA